MSEKMSSVWSTKKTCRICLNNSDNLQSLEDFYEYSLIKSIIKVNCILENNVDVPRNACNLCLAEIKIAYNLHNKCKNTNDTLINFYANNLSESNVHLYDEELSSTCNLIEPIIDPKKEFMLNVQSNFVTTNFNKEAFLPIQIVSDNLFIDKTVDKNLTHKLQKLIVNENGLLENIELRKGFININNKTCDICKYVAPYPSALVRHLRIHVYDRPFKCTICAKTFTNNSTLSKHKQVHNGSLQFICHTCGKQFVFRTSLVKHLSVHKSELFECEICKKSFSSKFNLEAHIKRHLRDGKFVCELCGKIKTTKYNLDVHMRVHSGEQHLKCSKCSYKTVSRGGLKIHERIHSGDKPFFCQECSERFISGLQLKRHIMKMHKMKLIIV